MKERTLAAMLAGLIVVAGGVVFYFEYYTKTPAYSLNLIRESVNKHDLAQFKKHVDLDTALSRAFDDLVDETTEEEAAKGNHALGTTFAKGIILSFKSTFVSQMRDEIYKNVESGTEKQAIEDNKQTKSNVDTKAVEEKTGMKKMQYKGIEYTNKDGKIANVGVKVFDPELSQDYVLDIKMRELDDGTWQAVEISNFKDFMRKVDEAKKANRVK